MDPKKIEAAMASGLSMVCSLCTKYWDARDLGVPDGKCLAVDGCGSPIAGDVFHEFNGPITNFEKFCFVCGDRATHGIRVDTHVRVIGCCKAHVELVKNLRPEGKQAPLVSIRSKDGETDSDQKVRLVTLKLGV